MQVQQELAAKVQELKGQREQLDKYEGMELELTALRQSELALQDALGRVESLEAAAVDNETFLSKMKKQMKDLNLQVMEMQLTY